jgi:putative membrane protein
MRLSRRRRRIVRLAAAVGLVGVLGPPLHQAAEASFAAHMVQHELLMLVVAPLLALGWPAPPWVDVLPRTVRRRALAAPGLRRAWRAATSPAGAWLLHAVALWAWHVPPLFDAAVRSAPAHALQHASFGVTAVLLWWSLLRPAAYGTAVAALFTTALHTSALGALLTFMPAPLYRVYADPGALEDQQLGGLIMWVPAGAALIAVGVAFAAAWLRDAERRADRLNAEAITREP